MPPPPGDLRVDGVIDAADQLLMLRYLRGEATLTEEQRTVVGDLAPYSAASGTIIGDDTVNAADAAVLARSLAGQDVDGDGLGLRMETRLGLSSFLRDTDGDGILDPDEDFDQAARPTPRRSATARRPGTPTPTPTAWSTARTRTHSPRPERRWSSRTPARSGAPRP